MLTATEKPTDLKETAAYKQGHADAVAEVLRLLKVSGDERVETAIREHFEEAED